MKLALKITAQRSTQYARLSETLACPEFLASPLGSISRSVETVRLAGQPHLLVDLEIDTLSEEQQQILSRLSALREIYIYHETVGGQSGPFLQPIEPNFTPFVPWEISEARRYKGKTNELFTHVMLNTAIFASAFSPLERLRILDPLAGGGTTLFIGLALGHDVFGIESGKSDVESTAQFVRQFCSETHIHYKETDERHRRAGRRYQFEIGPRKNTHALVLATGKTEDALSHMREINGGPHMHCIVGDLPYGIQHFGAIASLLEGALPAWEEMLISGGSLALAWNATRISREAMVEFIKQHSSLTVLDTPPYTNFAHGVDRVIKKRDLLVAVKK
jgi:hypothetical protein